MSLDPSADRSPRARPVGDAPVAALLDGAEELARRWAIALILERPLAEMAQVPLDALAQAAPDLCAQIVRALESDAAIEPLGAGGGASDRSRTRDGAPATPLLAALAFAAGAKALAEAVEALRGVLWEAILAELHDPPARQVADLADRLAFVCALALAETLAETGIGAHGDAAAQQTPPGLAREQILYTSAGSTPGRSGAVLVDEREDVFSAAAPRVEGDGEGRRSAPPEPLAAVAESREALGEQRPLGGESGSPRTTARPLPWDMPLQSERDSERRPLGSAGAGEAATSRRALYDEDPVMRITRGPGSPADERS